MWKSSKDMKPTKSKSYFWQKTAAISLATECRILVSRFQGDSSLVKIPMTVSSPESPSTDDPHTVKSGMLYLLDTRSLKHRLIGNDTWKYIFVSLKENGFFHFTDDEDRSCTENINLGDLHRPQIYLLSDTLFARRYTFAVRTSPTHVHHFAAESFSERDSWCVLLKCFAVPEVVGMHVGAEGNGTVKFLYRYHRSLFVKILEGRNIMTGNVSASAGGLAASGDLYCEIVIDGEKKVRTGIQRMSEAPFWGEVFVIMDIPIMKFGISMHVMSRNKHNRELLIADIFLINQPGQAIVPARSIPRGETLEDWHRIMREARQSTFSGTIMSSGSAGSGSAHHRMEQAGEVRLAVRYEEYVVLPMVEYEPLVEYLLNNDNFPALYELARAVPNLERLAENLLRIYNSYDAALLWICATIDSEVSAMGIDVVHILFRGNTLLTKSIDVYMKMVGMRYLDDAIGDIVREMCNEMIHFEVYAYLEFLSRKLTCSAADLIIGFQILQKQVDPIKLEKNEDLRSHWITLLHHAKALWVSIEASKDRLPVELRTIFAHLQSSVVSKFAPENPRGKVTAAIHTVRYTCVSKGELSMKTSCVHLNLNMTSWTQCIHFPEAHLSSYCDKQAMHHLTCCQMNTAILSPKLFGLVQSASSRRAHVTCPHPSRQVAHEPGESSRPGSKGAMDGASEWVYQREYMLENTRGFKTYIDYISTPTGPRPTNIATSIPTNFIPASVRHHLGAAVLLEDIACGPYQIDLPMELAALAALAATAAAARGRVTGREDERVLELRRICNAVEQRAGRV
ncbi:hypothetical protein BC937DRAFT_90498, partial [Endogone sp. FLAS-F59071]